MARLPGERTATAAEPALWDVREQFVQRPFVRQCDQLGRCSDLRRPEVLEPFTFAVIDVRPLIVAHENVATFADMRRVDHGVAELPALAIGQLFTFAYSRKAAVADDDK